MARRARATTAAAAAVIVAALVLAACGSAHHTKPPANPGGPDIPATSSSSTSVNPGGPNIPASSSSSSTSSTTPTGTALASTSTATSSTSTASHPAPRGGAHLDARFQLGAGGAVTPSQVLLPSGVPIVLQLVNSDSHGHAVSLAGADHSSERLLAGGTTSEPLGRLRKGTYRLLVDGHTAAHLVIGVAPGP